MRARVVSLAAIAASIVAFVVGAERGSQDASTLSAGGPRAGLVRSALGDPNPLGRMLALSSALRGMSVEDTDDVVAAFETAFNSGQPDAQALALLSEAWAPLDPEGAYQRIENWPREYQQEGRLSLLRVWARQDPRVALAVAEDVGDLDGWATHAVYTGWAESGDPQMWDFVMTLPQGMGRESASIPMMQWVIGRKGFEALFERVEALPSAAPERFKVAAFRTAAALAADHDPELALEFAKRHTGGAHERGLLRRVAVRWVRLDGPAAMAALLDLPEGEERERALREGYRTWLRWSRPEAKAWMGASPPEDPRFLPLLDLHAKALTNDDRHDPRGSIERAIVWSEAITDPDRRHQALVTVGVAFLNHAPGQARPWLKGHGIGAEVGAELRRLRLLMGR